jgi:hypothetical protein
MSLSESIAFCVRQEFDAVAVGVEIDRRALIGGPARVRFSSFSAARRWTANHRGFNTRMRNAADDGGTRVLSRLPVPGRREFGSDGWRDHWSTMPSIPTVSPPPGGLAVS